MNPLRNLPDLGTARTTFSKISSGASYGAPMDRRNAIRVAAALLAGTAGGCDAASPQASPTAPTPAPSAPHLPATTLPNLPSEITHGPRDRDRVALTFHGQGDPVIVRRLLDVLAAGHTRVTVLAVGTWLAAQPQLGRRIVAAGHELGNHTQHHADIKRMNMDAAQAEIAACAATLRRVTGSIGRWFRPSQTPHATPTIKAAAARAGYPVCLSYDVDSLDYTDPGATAVVSTTLAAVRPGSIVSLHFGHEDTIGAMPALLSGLRERGLTPVTMTELIA
jgi:peptidoglycan/xylan/chitin deacetylase (PgdA/CDA1 family)